MPTAAYFEGRCKSILYNIELLIQFWKETIQPSEFALDIIKIGYEVPFKETSLPYKFDNRSSAVKNRSFVKEEIKNFLESGCIRRA